MQVFEFKDNELQIAVKTTETWYQLYFKQIAETGISAEEGGGT